MDDLSSDLKPVIDAARAVRLTRSEKARLWERLEGTLEAAAPPTATAKQSRRFFGPWLVLAALPLATALGFVVGSHQQGSLAESPAALAAPAPHTSNSAPVAAVTRAGTTVENHRAEVPARAVQPPTSSRRSRRDKTITPPAVMATVTPAPVELEFTGFSSSPAVHDSSTERVSAAVGRTPVERGNAFDSTVGAEEPSGVATRPSLAASPAARAAAFRAKLEEESRARYQAALAQHARSASIRRPLSSVAGYAAW